jgi:hypothetical protein
MSLLWALLPDEALVLVIAAIGFAVMFRIITLRALPAILGGILLIAMLSPFIDSLMDTLPLWILLVLAIAFGLSLLRGFFSLFLGSRATDAMTGNLAASFLRGVFWLLFLPLTLLWRLAVTRR